jgi:hypothetical protein
MGHWRLLVVCLVALVAILAVAACGGGGSGESLEETEWAAQVCAIAQRLVDDVEAADDGVDPTTLTLEERKARADELQAPYIEAYEAAAADFAEISAPSDSRDFHEAIQTQAEELADATRAAVAKVGEATAVEDIEAENAALNVVLENTDEDIADAADSLTDEARAALRGVNRCGWITPVITNG